MLIRLIALLLVFEAFPCMGTERPKGPAEKPLFTWDLLWTGYWYKSISRAENGFPGPEDIFPGGTFYNLGDLGVTLPRQDISFRLLATDKRVLPFSDDDTKAGFNPGLGIYHHSSSSRLLWGVQSAYGLPARINHIWLRSVPFMEYRSPSSQDFKTEPAAQDSGEAYLYLGLPPKILPGFNAFASAALDKDLNPAFGTGIGLDKNSMELEIEGFYTRRVLPPRKVTTWFSAAPPLPERDFDIYALGMIFDSPHAAFAADWAWSKTFAWGRGVYGNFALRLGNKPWRFSLAGDGAGDRFAGRDGSTDSAGFRLAAKGEYFWTGSGYLRFMGIFRSPAPGKAFEQGSLSVYFRPSAPTAAAGKNAFPVRFSRASAEFSRDARTPGKTASTLDALLGFNSGPLSTVFSCCLSSLSCLDENERTPPLFQGRVFETFQSFKVSGELGWKPLNKSFCAFNLSSKLSYTIRAEKDPLWELSFNTSVKPGTWGRLSLNIAATDLPEKWNYTLSWRLAKP